MTKTKYWKNLCSRANPEMADSSAAGYQMRKHYMTYLLALECESTGQNEGELREFSEKQKKTKRRATKADKAGDKSIDAGKGDSMDRPTSTSPAPGDTSSAAAHGTPQPPPSSSSVAPCSSSNAPPPPPQMPPQAAAGV